MNLFDAIEQRRSVKHFDPDHRLTDEEIDKLFASARLSPTAFNLQHWRFVVVDDPELRKEIRKAAWDQAQITDASLLVILCGDLDTWDKDPGHYWRHAPEEVRTFMSNAIAGYYRGQDQMARDEVMRSCGIAAQTLMLTAKGLGYDSCPMDGFDFDAVAKLINLPDDHIISLFVTIGKALKPAPPRSGPIDHGQVFIRNRFA
jgi:nitroreductase